MNISEEIMSFKELEQKVQEKMHKQGCNMLKEFLERYDRALMESRDKCMYRHKGSHPTTIKTVMGEMEYSRVVYEVWVDGTKIGHTYLLDEAMGISCSGQLSELLCDQIVHASCEGTYRDAARAVSEMTGQPISHTTAWNVVQAVGHQVDELEQRAAELAAADKGAGTIETKVLFEEQDGINLSLQGNSRKEHGARKEMKVAIGYDGAKQTGKKRYKLTNKVACASFEGIIDFVKRKEGVIASIYSVDEIEMRFLNGDGANWIRHSQTDDTVHFQLDPFHRNKAVTEYVSDLESRERIKELLHSEDIDLLLHIIEVEALSTDDEKERENYLKLLGYFQNNKDALVPYYRRGLDIPEPPDGKQYRRMGAMESNIFTIIGNRMKGRRHCWSIPGAENLARLLCLKHTGKLRGILDKLSAVALPEHYTEEFKVEFSAAKIPQRVGKGYNGFHQTMIPSNMKWFKNLASQKQVYKF